MDNQHKKYPDDNLKGLYGRNVYKIRKSKPSKMNRQRLAYLAEITDKYLGFIERGERCPSMKVMIQIANALNEPIESFFR